MATDVPIRVSVLVVLALLAAVGALALPSHAAAGGGRLDAALDKIIADPEGPPGLSVLIQRGRQVDFRRRGVSNIETGARPTPDRAMRIASMAKSMNGAVTLSLASNGKLRIGDTPADWIPGLWPKANGVTIAEMLQHTAGLPDYIHQRSFIDTLIADPGQYLPPQDLIGFVNALDPLFEAGSEYHYSDSDNVMVGLIDEAAAGAGYDRLLRREITKPLGLENTSLPTTLAMPRGYLHGYEPGPDGYEDVSKFINPALAWASGGVVSTPADVNRFFRAYVGGDLIGKPVRKRQDRFVRGRSSPPGPGRNDAGLAVFRYRTRCGTVFGHTGSYPGYRLFAAASGNGKRSIVFAVNSQIVPGQGKPRVTGLIRRAQADAVCLALR